MQRKRSEVSKRERNFFQMARKDLEKVTLLFSGIIFNLQETYNSTEFQEFLYTSHPV